MPWHVSFPPGSKTFHIVHERDDDGPLWSGTVEIFRGSPAVDDHPEIEHAVRRIGNPALFEDFIRHRWTYSIPDAWGGRSNLGPDRAFLELQATGGVMNWTLLLKLPRNAPRFVWVRICRAFNASLKENAMKPSLDNTPKPQTLNKGPVPTPQALPDAAKAGANTIKAGS